MSIRSVARIAAAAVAGAAAVFVVGIGAGGLEPARVAAQEQAPVQREFTVTASKFRFDPPRLEVNQNDLVKVTLRSGDIAHSFTVDAYRIAKRVGVGQSVTFEFRADQPGTFPIYCNLRQDDGCREMRGELVVSRR